MRLVRGRLGMRLGRGSGNEAKERGNKAGKRAWEYGLGRE